MERKSYRLIVGRASLSRFLLPLIGLTVAFAVFYTLASYLADVASTNNDLPGADRLFQVASRFNASSNPRWFARAPAVAVDVVRSMGGGSLASPMIDYDTTVRAAGGLQRLTLTLVNDEFPSILRLKSVEGDADAALHDPNLLVLNSTTAHRLFGTASAVGAVLSLNGKGYRVGAVVEDLPENTTLLFGALVNVRTDIWPKAMRDDILQNWGSVYGRVVIRTGDTISRAEIEAQLLAAVRLSPYTSQLKPNQINDLAGRPAIDLRVETAHDAFFDPEILADPGTNNHGSWAAIAALGVLLVLTLVVATGNFANAAGHIVWLRQKEIIVRKIFGASAFKINSSIGLQAVALSITASLLGLIASVSFSGPISALLEHQIAPLKFKLIAAAGFALPILIGCLGSLFPVRIAAQAKASSNLGGRGAEALAGGRWLLRTTVFLQLVVVTVMSSVSLVVALQQQLSLSRYPGFDANGLMHLDLPVKADDAKARLFLSQAKSIPGIAAATIASDAVGAHDAFFSTAVEIDGQTNPWELKQVDGSYFNVYGVKPVAGKLFDGSRDDVTTAPDVVISEHTAKLLGGKTYESLLGKTLWLPKLNRSVVVVGVAPEIAHDSLHAAPHPLIYILSRETQKLSLRIAGNSADALLKLRALWEKVFPDDLFEINSATEVLRGQYNAEQQLSDLLAIVSCITFLFAITGVFAASAQSVARQQKDLAIRKVFGAGRVEVKLLGMREIVNLVVVSLAVAIPLSELLIYFYLKQFSVTISFSAVYPLAASLFIFTMAFSVSWLKAQALLGKRPQALLRT